MRRNMRLDLKALYELYLQRIADFKFGTCFAGFDWSGVWVVKEK